MAQTKSELLQGTLDLLILKTLSTGPMHGYAIVQRIQQRSDDVLVVEDIIDTGHTLKHVLEILETRHPRRMEVCALLSKPSRRETEIAAKWLGFEIPDRFVVGYGIDYAQRNRNLPHIGAVRFTG